MASAHGEATDEPTGAYAGEARDRTAREGSSYRSERVTTSSPRGTRTRTSYASGRDASIGTLISSLLSDTSHLIRDEVRLAKAEVSEKASQAVDGVKSLAIGGALALLGLIYLIFGLIGLLGEIMPDWVAAFIVGGLIALIGGILLAKGIKELKARNLAPTRTRDNVQRDAQMVRESV